MVDIKAKELEMSPAQSPLFVSSEVLFVFGFLKT